MAIDGEALRRSFDRSICLGAMHLVSTWLTDVGLPLAQVATAEKSNEITAIPELLKLVDCQGAIITIDAMGTQSAIAEQLVDSGADDILPMTGNQSGLQRAVVKYVDAPVTDDFRNSGPPRHVMEEQKHGRAGRRIFVQFPMPANMTGKGRWTRVRTIGLVVCETRAAEHKQTTDIR